MSAADTEIGQAEVGFSFGKNNFCSIPQSLANSEPLLLPDSESPCRGSIQPAFHFLQNRQGPKIIFDKIVHPQDSFETGQSVGLKTGK